MGASLPPLGLFLLFCLLEIPGPSQTTWVVPGQPETGKSVHLVDPAAQARTSADAAGAHRQGNVPRHLPGRRQRGAERTAPEERGDLVFGDVLVPEFLYRGLHGVPPRTRRVPVFVGVFVLRFGTLLGCSDFPPVTTQLIP